MATPLDLFKVITDAEYAKKGAEDFDKTLEQDPLAQVPIAALRLLKRKVLGPVAKNLLLKPGIGALDKFNKLDKKVRDNNMRGTVKDQVGDIRRRIEQYEANGVAQWDLPSRPITVESRLGPEQTFVRKVKDAKGKQHKMFNLEVHFDEFNDPIRRQEWINKILKKISDDEFAKLAKITDAKELEKAIKEIFIAKVPGALLAIAGEWLTKQLTASAAQGDELSTNFVAAVREGPYAAMIRVFADQIMWPMAVRQICAKIAANTNNQVDQEDAYDLATGSKSKMKDIWEKKVDDVKPGSKAFAYAGEFKDPGTVANIMDAVKSKKDPYTVETSGGFYNRANPTNDTWKKHVEALQLPAWVVQYVNQPKSPKPDSTEQAARAIIEQVDQAKAYLIEKMKGHVKGIKHVKENFDTRAKNLLDAYLTHIFGGNLIPGVDQFPPNWEAITDDLLNQLLAVAGGRSSYSELPGLLTLLSGGAKRYETTVDNAINELAPFEEPITPAEIQNEIAFINAAVASNDPIELQNVYTQIQALHNLKARVNVQYLSHSDAQKNNEFNRLRTALDNRLSSLRGDRNYTQALSQLEAAINNLAQQQNQAQAPAPYIPPNTP